MEKESAWRARKFFKSQLVYIYTYDLGFPHNELKVKRQVDSESTWLYMSSRKNGPLFFSFEHCKGAKL